MRATIGKWLGGAAVFLLILAGVDLLRAGRGIEIDANGYNLFYLGTADFNGDNRQDLWTSNHNAAANILASTGDPDQPFAPFVHLPHDPRIPELANRETSPPRPTTGITVSWVHFGLELWAGRLRQPTTLSITFAIEPTIFVAQDARATVTQDGDRWIAVITLETGGNIRLGSVNGKNAGWPMRFDLGDAQIRFGADARAVSGGFDTYLRDYHSIVALDLNGDTHRDIVAFGGGMAGYVTRLKPDAREMLLLSNDDGTYTALDGPPKLGCSSRGAQVEGKRIRVACGRGAPDQLWTYENGTWIGGPTEIRTPTTQMDTLSVGNRYCLGVSLLRQLRWHLIDTRVRCLAADFDGDARAETVLFVEGPNRVSSGWIYGYQGL